MSQSHLSRGARANGRNQWGRIALLAAFSISAITIARGQSTGQTLYDQASQALSSSDYPTAIQDFQDVIAKFPSESFIPNAWFYLGLAQLSGGHPDQSLDSFKKALDPSAPADIQESALFYSGQAAFTQAAGAPAGSRDAALKKALDFFAQYFQQYPQGTLREEALFSRAETNLTLADYDAAQKDLATLLNDFPDSTSHPDYLYWSARGYAMQADALRTAKDEAGEAEAGKKGLAAYDQLGDLPSAVVLANDAHAEKAALLMLLAASDQDYEEAIAAYRKVLAKDQLIPLQQQALADLAPQISQAAQAHNKAAYQGLLDRRQRAQSRLDALKTGPDPKVDALLHIAQALVYLKRADEARVTLRYLTPFATAPEQKQQIAYLTILTYVLQGTTDKADAGLKQYRIDFAQDPDAQNLRLLIAQTLQKQGDLAAAEAQYRKGLEESPDGPVAEQASLGLGGVLLAEKKEDDLIALLDPFVKKNPDAPGIAEARYDLGQALAGQKRYDEAVAQFKAVAADPKAGTLQEGATLQEGFAQLNAGKYDEALAILQALVKQYPGGEQAAAALFYEGIAQEAKADPASAGATYERIVTDYHGQSVAPMAEARLMRLAQAAGKPEEAAAAAKRLMTDFPASPQAVEAAFNIGQAMEKTRAYDQAAAAYQFIVARPDKLGAPVAQARIAAMWIAAAQGLGNYKALNDSEKAQWQTDTDAGIKAASDALEKFPSARESGAALEEVVKLEVFKIDAGLQTLDQATAVFSDWEGRAASDIAKGRLELARIGVIAQRGDATQALALYQKIEATHPLFDPEDLDRYGTLLLNAKQYDPATAIFTQLQQGFAKEPSAQAAAVYGLGAVQLAQGNTSAADGYFDTLEKQYAWSPKIWAATLGRGRAAEDRGDPAQARSYYQKVIMAPASSPEMKARGLLGFARTLEKEGKLVDNPATPNEPNAANNYLKIDALFDSVRDVAAEGLWRAGQVLEKANQPDKAKAAYQSLAKKYPESPFASQAQARLTILGV